MKVSLINARLTDVTSMPLGMLYVGAVLEEAGHKVEGFDPLPTIGNNRVAKRVLKSNPDIVGISVTTAQYARAIDIANEIKDLSGEIPIVFGGVHPTVLPKESLNNDCVDFVVMGEGELVMRDLCEALERDNEKQLPMIKGIAFKEGGRVRVNEPRGLIENLDDIPFPARDLLPVKWYLQPPGKVRGFWLDRSITLMASRGCPYHCIYCDSNRIFGRTPRYSSPERVVEEIKMLIDRYKVQGAWFVDDELTINETWMENFCNLMIEEDLDFKWSCQARVNHGSKELLMKMKAAKCVQVDYGVESGSSKVLKILKKGTTPEQIKRKFKETGEVGIRAGATNIIGTPGETLEDIEMTAQLIKEIKPAFAEFYYLTPYPGTELYNMAKANKWLHDEKFSKEWLKTRVIDKPLISINMPKDELMKVRSRLNNMFIWRNYHSYLQNPRFVWGISQILLKGLPGLPSGLKRFLKSGKFEVILYSMLEYKRLHYYEGDY